MADGARLRAIATLLVFALAVPAFLDLSPDGKLIAVSQRESADSGGDIWLIDGPRGARTRFTFDSPVTTDGQRDVVWSPDGLRIAFSSFKKGNRDVVVKNASGLPIPIIQSPFQENEAQFSFDGKWLAYGSNESGRFQTYVISFPALDLKRQVSTDGGSQPRWRRDGKELYYLAADGKLMAVDISTGATPTPITVVVNWTAGLRK